jgi:deazaflavin-dependent oxidoreductase (nitroreductase family)
MDVTLTTTGRRSGEPRTVPLYAWEDGDRLVLVGSWGGSATDPDWVSNLRADPHATLKKGRRELTVHASEVDASERDRLWKLVVEAFPMYAFYQRKTERIIPLFVLETVNAV